MSTRARAIQTLYRTKRITIEGVRNAVASGIITKEEYSEIVGTDYN